MNEPADVTLQDVLERIAEQLASISNRVGPPPPDRALLRAVRELAAAATAGSAGGAGPVSESTALERDHLAMVLRLVDDDVRSLLASKRWLVGDRLVRTANAARRRGQDELASERLLRHLDGVRPLLDALAVAPEERPDDEAGHAPRPWTAPVRRRYDVVVLANVDWDTRRQRPQQLAAQFARQGHRVLYVVASDWLPDDDARGYRLRELEPGITEVVLAAPHHPDRYRRVASAPLVERWREAFDRLVDDLEIDAAALHLHLQSWTPLAFELRRRFGWKLVYDCMDEWHEFPGMGQHIVDAEHELVAGADLVLVTAQRLLDKWSKVNPSCVLVRNAVDHEWYVDRAGPSALLEAVGHPVVGFLGALAPWVDVELVAEVARAHPDWRFVLVGDVFVDDLAGLDELPNVELPGLRPYEEMPLWLSSFDVAIIPFRQDHITDAVDPVKFYEYVSLGTPVVTTPLPELDEHREHFYVGEDAAGFAAAIETALAEPEHRRLERASIARRNSWADRYRIADAATTQLWPLVSVVVVTYGRLELTKACIESLLANTTWPRWELVVVDNASPDGTRRYLDHIEREHRMVRVIANAENRGFAAANNQGLAVAGGDVLVLLNNDTTVAPGWLEPLLAHAADPECGLVGPRTNNVGNEARYEVAIHDASDVAAVTRRLRLERAGERFDMHMLAMFCVAMRRDVYNKVGPLDEGYGIGLFEDDDYSERVRRAGYRVVCAADAFVHHVGQGTFGALIESGAYEQLWQANRARFESRWGDWRAQG